MPTQAEKLEGQLAPEVWVAVERVAPRGQQERAALVRRARASVVGQAAAVRRAAVVRQAAVASQARAAVLVQLMAEAVMAEMTAARGALAQTVARMRVRTATQDRRR
ncbi:MAG TPA: hypothetical protein VK550_00190 [Polyangiaceae bacterium]|nr:hypothetical protein [Polyangiaceae bacterium]